MNSTCNNCASVITDADNQYSADPAKTVIDLLRDKKMTFSCAESCTGGLFSGRMVSVSGASAVYKMGFITYANEAKEELLGVKKDTLIEFGAVSEECARQMAYGAAMHAKADVAVGITGIAGPDGGTKEKPVGLVYIGCYCNGTTTVKRFVFDGDRQHVRDSAVEQAILLMKNCIINYS